MLDLAGIEVAITVLSQTSFFLLPGCPARLIGAVPWYVYILVRTILLSFFQAFADEYLEVTVTCCPTGYIGSAVEIVS